jgi:hypothetical protein
MYFETALPPNQKLIIAANRPDVASSQIKFIDPARSFPSSIRDIKAVTLTAMKRPKKT